MTSLETLGCRRDDVENQMFEIATSLSRHLHAIEKRVSGLAARVHKLVHEGGRMPIEEKSFRLMREIQDVLYGLDLSGAMDQADRVAELKAEVAAYEEEIDRELAARTASRERLEQDVTAPVA